MTRLCFSCPHHLPTRYRGKVISVLNEILGLIQHLRKPATDLDPECTLLSVPREKEINWHFVKKLSQKFPRLLGLQACFRVKINWTPKSDAWKSIPYTVPKDFRAVDVQYLKVPERGTRGGDIVQYDVPSNPCRSLAGSLIS